MEDEVGNTQTPDVPCVGQAQPILVWPDKRLHQVSDPVTTFDHELDQLVANMFASMKVDDGIGLAAPQIGVTKRVLVLQIEASKPLVFVNPEVIAIAGDEVFEWEEGCLSVPGYFEKRKRPNSIALKYQDQAGVAHEVQVNGIYAFAIQHEIDHLDGKVFIDGASMFKAQRVKSRIRKFMQKKANKVQVYKTLDLPPTIASAITSAKMDPVHNHLNVFTE